ncbi:hypothetical protein MED121_21370 [Marinomonas sp. MED121]|nr:hypothetical protein MED121_21370 [Marinomonas sp. MED121]
MRILYLKREYWEAAGQQILAANHTRFNLGFLLSERVNLLKFDSNKPDKGDDTL